MIVWAEQSGTARSADMSAQQTEEGLAWVRLSPGDAWNGHSGLLAGGGHWAFEYLGAAGSRALPAGLSPGGWRPCIGDRPLPYAGRSEKRSEENYVGEQQRISLGAPNSISAHA